jgi:hypothetical protein
VWRKTAAREHALACPANTIRNGCNKKPHRAIKLRLARSAHVHLVGLLLISSGFWFSLTAIDRYSHWPESVLLSEVAAEVVAKGFVTVLVTPSAALNRLNRSGMRLKVRAFKTLAGITGFHLTRITKWYPAANCMIESYIDIWRLVYCAMPMSSGPRLFCWFLQASSAHGRRHYRHHQQNCFMKNPAFVSSILHPVIRLLRQRYWLRNPATSPHRVAPTLMGARTRHATPSSYLRIQQKHHTSAYEKNAILGTLQNSHVGPCKVLLRDDTTDAIGVHGVATTVFVELLSPAYAIQHWSCFTSSNCLQHSSFRTAIRLSGLPVRTADSRGGAVVNATYYSCHKDAGHNIRNATYLARSFYCPKGTTRCSLSSTRHNSLLGTGQATSAVRILYCLKINFTTYV